MDNKVAAVAPASDPGVTQSQTSVEPAHGGAAPEAPTPGPVEMRLVIERDQASGTYVYKTINRQTGEVVLQLPRAEVLKLKEDLGYSVGSVIRTEA